MEKFILIACFLAITVYMAVTAWEDHKSCEVTRWKHLLGGVPAIYLLCSRYVLFSWHEYVILFIFTALYILAGCIGIYGMADGYVLAILTLFFGSIGGVAGSGIVVFIMIAASVSFLITHLGKCIVKRKRLFFNMTGAFIPHILIGYVIAWMGVFLYAA